MTLLSKWRIARRIYIAMLFNFGIVMSPDSVNSLIRKRDWKIKLRALLTSNIDPKDYRTIKSEIEEKLVRLEANLTEMTTSVNSPVNLEKMLDKAVNALSNIDLVYARSDTNQKREIIGSIYPEKLVFSESGYRTIKINEAAAIIFQINSDLEQEKSGTFSDFSQKFRFVPAKL